MQLRHFLKLTIAGLNALSVHTAQSLFCGSIWRHIRTMDGDHGYPVAGVEMMAKRFTHVATVAEEH